MALVFEQAKPRATVAAGTTNQPDQATPLTNVEELRQELGRWLTGMRITVWRSSHQYSINPASPTIFREGTHYEPMSDEVPDDDTTVYHVEIEAQDVHVRHQYHSGFIYLIDLADRGIISRRMLELWGQEYTKRFLARGTMPRVRAGSVRQ